MHRYTVQSVLHGYSEQVHQALAAADANRDGTISAAEGKALPSAFADNFERYQARYGQDVSARSFERSMIAYAAIALHRADNGNGILSAKERKTLPTGLASDLGLSAAHRSSSGGFVGRGAGSEVTLGGVSGTQRPVSRSIEALDQKLTLHPDWPFFSADFRLDPAALKAALADPEQKKKLLNDVLFRATGTDFATRYPSYYTPDRLEVSGLATAGKGSSYLMARLAELGAFGKDGASRSTVAGGVSHVAKSVFQGATQSYGLTWTNHDDAQFHAMVSVNEQTGEVRVAGFYPTP